MGDAVKEIRRAVDRIYHPIIARIAWLWRMFLTDDAIFGVGFFYEFPNAQLDILISFRDKVLQTFVDDIQAADTPKVV